jgi:hypothetical protein
VNPEDPFGVLLFLSLFELLGGGALGGGLRSILRGNGLGWFFVVWGAGFAGIPLLMGALMFLPSGHAIYFYAQLFLLLGALVTVALLPDDFLQSTPGDGSYGGAIAGAIMTMIGGTVVILNLRQGIGIGLIIGGFFAIAGASILAIVTARALRSLQ